MQPLLVMKEQMIRSVDMVKEPNSLIPFLLLSLFPTRTQAVDAFFTRCAPHHLHLKLILLCRVYNLRES